MALVDAGVDLLLAEAFASPDEALAATDACVATGIETWVALTAGPNGDLLTPRDLASAARRCTDAGASAVLVNCVPASKTLAYVEALARGGGRFGAYANAGDKANGSGGSPPARRATGRRATRSSRAAGSPRGRRSSAGAVGRDQRTSKRWRERRERAIPSGRAPPTSVPRAAK